MSVLVYPYTLLVPFLAQNEGSKKFLRKMNHELFTNKVLRRKGSIESFNETLLVREKKKEYSLNASRL